MRSWVNFPFALFCVVDMPHEALSRILKDAHSSVGAWIWWLATKNYEDAPQKDPKYAHEGTEAPVDERFKSDFIGSEVEDLAEWLKKKPESVDLDSHHFIILDRRVEKDGTVVVCRIGDDSLEGDKLTSIRKDASMASLRLGGLEPFEWEEMIGDGPDMEDIEY